MSYAEEQIKRDRKDFFREVFISFIAGFLFGAFLTGSWLLP